MRRPLAAPVLALVLSACQGAAPERADATSTDATSTSSSASSEGAGGAAPSCTFRVSGAISRVSVTTVPVAGFIGGTMLSCGEIGGDPSDSLLIDVGPLHGPGVYTSLAGPGALHEYQISSCTSNGPCPDVQSFGDEADSAGCTMVISGAPVEYEDGAGVNGTFFCPDLVDDADPTRRVALSGSFSAVFEPPPN